MREAASGMLAASLHFRFSRVIRKASAQPHSIRESDREEWGSRWDDSLSERLEDPLSDALRPWYGCWSRLCRCNSARELKCVPHCRHSKSLCFMSYAPRNLASALRHGRRLDAGVQPESSQRTCRQLRRIPVRARLFNSPSSVRSSAVNVRP